MDSSSRSKIRQILATISLFGNGAIVGIIAFAYGAHAAGLLTLTPTMMFVLPICSCGAILVLSLLFWIDELASVFGKILTTRNRMTLFEDDTRIKHKHLSVNEKNGGTRHGLRHG